MSRAPTLASVARVDHPGQREDGAPRVPGPVAADALPAVRNEIARPRLIDRLAQRWNASVLLLEAAGGFGKTVAIAQAIGTTSPTRRGSTSTSRATAATPTRSASPGGSSTPSDRPRRRSAGATPTSSSSGTARPTPSPRTSRCSRRRASRSTSTTCTSSATHRQPGSSVRWCGRCPPTRTWCSPAESCPRCRWHGSVPRSRCSPSGPTSSPSPTTRSRPSPSSTGPTSRGSAAPEDGRP